MMSFNQSVAKFLCLILALGIFNLGMIKSSHAAMITTSQAITQMTHAQNLTTVKDFMQRSDVRQKMVDMGVNPAEADLRIASLTTEEVREVAWQIDNNVAGADVIVIGLGTILLIILIVLLLQRV